MSSLGRCIFALVLLCIPSGALRTGEQKNDKQTSQDTKHEGHAQLKGCPPDHECCTPALEILGIPEDQGFGEKWVEHAKVYFDRFAAEKTAEGFECQDEVCVRYGQPTCVRTKTQGSSLSNGFGMFAQDGFACFPRGVRPVPRECEKLGMEGCEEGDRFKWYAQKSMWDKLRKVEAGNHLSTARGIRVILSNYTNGGVYYKDAKLEDGCELGAPANAYPWEE